MTKTVFYAWQSDLPNNTNRGFIRGCIDRAINNIHADVGVEDALRAEEGVKGAPGNVDVARTIFERIDECGIFVPDISIVTQEGAKRPMPNPNAMIEYGRATSSLGDNWIVPVFNTAFGDWLKDRPFDMRHKNAPITYCLPENHDQDKRDAARKVLVKQLATAFREIVDAGLIEDRPTGEPAFDPVAPYRGYEGNKLPVALLGRIDPRRPLHEGDAKVWLRNGPQMFLRLIPTQPGPEFEPLDLREWMKSSQVQDLMGHRTGSAFYYARNADGASAFTLEAKSTVEQEKETFAVSLTQAFRNGEVWGIDTWLLDPERTMSKRNEGFPVIPPHTLEEGVIHALSQYLRFARDTLKLPLPLRWVAGIREIENHQFEFDDHEFGRSLHRDCTEEGLVDDYTARIHRIVEPFFDKLWLEFGRRRPSTVSETWERASGFDLDA